MLGHSVSSLNAGISILAGVPTHESAPPEFLITEAENAAQLAAYHRLRRDSFVSHQGLFTGTDLDDIDDDPRTVVLVATAGDGTVLGGVRLAPRGAADIGWWTGSRLVVTASRQAGGIGPAVVRAACSYAKSRGVLRFEATVQQRYSTMFARIGWQPCGADLLIGRCPHVRMRWPLNPFQPLVGDTKSFLGDALSPLRGQDGGLGAAGFCGDDGVPLPGSDLIAACDAIIPSMVQRDPEWAGWCSVLVNVNDLAAMGAAPIGLLDAVGAPTRSLLTRIIRGIARASQAWRVPVLGGHTQLGVPAALAVTALGTTPDPVPAGGGAAGDALRFTADLTGGWRPGYHGRQWDSTSTRGTDDLAAMVAIVARLRPRAAKDVSMAGIVGAAGMLAEASGTGAELEVAAIPRPRDAELSFWLTCFPGFAMLTADRVGGSAPALPAGMASAECGRLTRQGGVSLRWPDGVTTPALAPDVTGLGRA
jgi:putative N-acetyltransferase (TIGR04045 family)